MQKIQRSNSNSIQLKFYHLPFTSQFFFTDVGPGFGAYQPKNRRIHGGEELPSGGHEEVSPSGHH